MRARAWLGGWVILVLAALPAAAAPDPQPQVIPYTDLTSVKGDPNPPEGPLQPGAVRVFVDPAGGTYVLGAGGTAKYRLFYGTAKKLYEQVGVKFAGTGDGTWSLNTFTPRLVNYQSGELARRPDGSLAVKCFQDPPVVVTELLGEQAKQKLAKVKLYQPALPYQPYLLTRDDRGVYYYIDGLTSSYGGSETHPTSGFRLFVGKRGAMKRISITDYTVDSAGAVFNTKAGDFRFVATSTTTQQPDGSVTSSQAFEWIRGEQHTPLVNLDTVQNRVLIYTDLGVYTFLGGLCDNPTPNPAYDR